MRRVLPIRHGYWIGLDRRVSNTNTRSLDVGRPLPFLFQTEITLSRPTSSPPLPPRNHPLGYLAPFFSLRALSVFFQRRRFRQKLNLFVHRLARSTQRRRDRIGSNWNGLRRVPRLTMPDNAHGRRRFDKNEILQ